MVSPVLLLRQQMPCVSIVFYFHTFRALITFTVSAFARLLGQLTSLDAEVLEMVVAEEVRDLRVAAAASLIAADLEGGGGGHVVVVPHLVLVVVVALEVLRREVRHDVLLVDDAERVADLKKRRNGDQDN
uniref:Secreted protein n=1 Tax=Steinernema glaseri TaxID=37863 RepID=A0A1I7Y1W5_9BILA